MMRGHTGCISGSKRVCVGIHELEPSISPIRPLIWPLLGFRVSLVVTRTRY